MNFCKDEGGALFCRAHFTQAITANGGSHRLTASESADAGAQSDVEVARKEAAVRAAAARRQRAEKRAADRTIANEDRTDTNPNLEEMASLAVAAASEVETARKAMAEADHHAYETCLTEALNPEEQKVKQALSNEHGDHRQPAPAPPLSPTVRATMLAAAVSKSEKSARDMKFTRTLSSSLADMMAAVATAAAEPITPAEFSAPPSMPAPVETKHIDQVCSATQLLLMPSDAAETREVETTSDAIVVVPEEAPPRWCSSRCLSASSLAEVASAAAAAAAAADKAAAAFTVPSGEVGMHPNSKAVSLHLAHIRSMGVGRAQKQESEDTASTVSVDSSSSAVSHVQSEQESARPQHLVDDQEARALAEERVKQAIRATVGEKIRHESRQHGAAAVGVDLLCGGCRVIKFNSSGGAQATTLLYTQTQHALTWQPGGWARKKMQNRLIPIADIVELSIGPETDAFYLAKQHSPGCAHLSMTITMCPSSTARKSLHLCCEHEEHFGLLVAGIRALIVDKSRGSRREPEA